jgi:activator of Hsp90 ATPase-like protein
VWEPPDPDDRETVVTLSFHDVDRSTQVGFTQGVFAIEERRALHEQGWRESFERLQELVSVP